MQDVAKRCSEIRKRIDLQIEKTWSEKRLVPNAFLLRNSFDGLDLLQRESDPLGQYTR